MKKLAAIITVTVLILSLAACAAPAEPSPSESAAPSEIPSAAPSVKPSTEPSAEPSASPDDIDAYWQGRTLTSDSGDLMIDAARWVRDYYRSIVDSSSVDLAAARMYDLWDDGFSLYTECYFYDTKVWDEHTTPGKYWHLRSVCFDFEATDGGYRYAGLFVPPNTSSLKISASLYGEKLDMDFYNDIWRFESIIGTLANGTVIESLPPESELKGSFSYEYADSHSNWDLYEDSTYRHLWARCSETGEIFDCGWNNNMLIKIPEPQELCDAIRNVVSNSLFLNTSWGNFYIPDDVRTSILEHIDFVRSSDQTRPSHSSRDIWEEDSRFSFSSSDGFFGLISYKNTDVVQINCGDMSLVVYDASDFTSVLDNAGEKLVDTVRDGQFLTNYTSWGVPEEKVEEYELLRRAADLLAPFDGSNWLAEYGKLDDAATIEYNGMTYCDYTPAYDPDADDWTAHISSYAEFEAYVREVFCNELADRCLREGWHYSTEENPPFIKGPNGELYSHGSGRGGGNPAVGNLLALYRFEPVKDVLVLRYIHEHIAPDNGDWYDYDNYSVVGETAWDTVFVREDGRWKLLDTSQIVP